MKVCCKAIVACLFFSSFFLGYTSKVSSEKLTAKLNFSEDVYVAQNWGLRTRSVFKFLGVKIIEGTTDAIVDNVLSPKSKAPPPPSQSTTNPFSRLTYIGSFFQCSHGCKYYWSQDTGWQIFDERDQEWFDIPHPSGTVVRTHNIYVNNEREYILRHVRHGYGFDPQEGWVYF